MEFHNLEISKPLHTVLSMSVSYHGYRKENRNKIRDCTGYQETEVNLLGVSAVLLHILGVREKPGGE